ncbi:MAG TPA: beta-propeller domain-containing protein [Polyangiaceae bacterium]|nr:beta-propeller domain-containing protein [Polyangiaceae bacterium]
MARLSSGSVLARCTWFLPLALSSLACGTSSNDEIGATDFFSYIPGASDSATDGAESGADGDMGSAAGGSAATGGATGAPGDDGGGEPERLIAEADLIQREGDRLYALSQYAGLSVIDVSDPTKLRVLGSYRATAMPFEMYVKDGVAHVLFNEFVSWTYDTDAWSYQGSARVQVLDLRDPSKIALLGESEVPGSIADSRKVGDVLYLVTNQDGYCWNCDAVANTRVSSFDVSDPAAFRQVDRIILENAPNTYSWGRSISVTAERIYVADNSYDGSDWQAHGAIDVIDITDPNGDLVQGAHVAINGPIESRWQMDEYEGTLRVISQAGGWGSGLAPVLETFQVTGADQVSPLASLTMVLPRPETLQSVRFDGQRAFAVTFEQTDPLFTFNLSDPAVPVQVGELEIPGWIYHMEPRGDRLFAIGYDNTVANASLHASIYDVSDLSQPTQLSRVNFGGDWSNFAEDQDRIHKAFQIDLTNGLIAIPFSGYSSDETGCSWSGSSGIQLIDATTEALTLRGVAPQFGQARRALVLDDVLLGVSDFSVETFDITDRSSPQRLDRVELARNVTALRQVGSTVLRFGQDYWLGQTTLDFARLDEVENAEGLGTLDLTSVAPGDTCQSYSFWDNQVLVHGGYAYLPRRGFLYGGDGKTLQFLDVYIVDVRDRTNPRLVGARRLATGVNEQFSRVIQAGDALLLGRQRGSYYSDPWTGTYNETSLGYDVFALDDPLAPELTAHIDLPDSVARGGFGYPATGCMVDMGWGFWGGGYYGYYGNGGDIAAFVDGSIVASQHEEAVGDGTGRVRYYLDRIDVSDPHAPVLMPAVNIPGSIIHFESSRLVTLEYTRSSHPARDWADCQEPLSYLRDDQCYVYQRRLNAVEIDGNVARRTDLAEVDPEHRYPSTLAASSSHVFAMSYSPDGGAQQVRTFSWSGEGELSQLDDVKLQAAWSWNLVARGARAITSNSGLLEVVDASSGTPSVSGHPVGGYACSDVEIVEDRVLCAMGTFGIQTVDLK